MLHLISTLFALVLLVGAATGTGQAAGRQEATPTTADCATTSAAENEALVTRWYDEAINGHDVAVLDEILAEDIAHESGAFPDEPGPRFIMEALFVGFPDITQTMDDVISADDTVVVRWTATGTHSGNFMGIPPTGRQFTIAGIDIHTMRGSRMAEHWHVVDQLAQMQQLGIIPQPEPLGV